MSPLVLDATLAYLHHFGVGCFVAFLAMETALVRVPFTAASLNRLGIIDAFAGLSAALILLAGASRVMWGMKGPEYYVGNHVFWTKMALFVLVALASVP